MDKRKTTKKTLVKCKGFNVSPCFRCKRWDKNHNQTLVGKLNYNRQGLNSCEHFI